MLCIPFPIEVQFVDKGLDGYRILCMADYRRIYQPGGTYFFTLITHDRRKIFLDPLGRHILHESIQKEQAKRPFEILAMVLLPEHLHCIWRLPESDAEYSTRWACIKKEFTQSWIKQGGAEAHLPEYRNKLREKGIWQRRFWEHTIRDEADFNKHINYVHYNPVKHGLVSCPHRWRYSSFHRWVKEGFYPANWLCDCNHQKCELPNFDDIAKTVGE